MSDDIFVRFWGVRGSIPTPGPRTRRYGGNTSCVEVKVGETLMVFDAGTGMRELGVHLLKARAKELTVHLFLSHPHWDHIQGFPFFGPAYVSSTTMYVYGPKGDDKNYQLLSGQMANAYFPVRFSDLGANIVARSFNGTTVKAGDVKVKCFGQKHPGGSTGFRVESGTKSVVFATDSELDQVLVDPTIVKREPESLRELPDDLVSYARRLTQMWLVIFVAMALRGLWRSHSRKRSTFPSRSRIARIARFTVTWLASVRST